MCCVICEMPHTHTHTLRLTYACLHKHIVVWTHTHIDILYLVYSHVVAIKYLPNAHTHTHTHTHYKQDQSLGSRRYAEESECFLFLNAAPPEPPVNHPDYFIMNLNLSSRAVSTDRSPGLANALGYFWQHENPQNMGSFHISILRNNLSNPWILSIQDQRPVKG